MKSTPGFCPRSGTPSNRETEVAFCISCGRQVGVNPVTGKFLNHAGGKP